MFFLWHSSANKACVSWTNDSQFFCIRVLLGKIGNVYLFLASKPLSQIGLLAPHCLLFASVSALSPDSLLSPLLFIEPFLSRDTQISFTCIYTCFIYIYLTTLSISGHSQIHWLKNLHPNLDCPSKRNQGETLRDQSDFLLLSLTVIKSQLHRTSFSQVWNTYKDRHHGTPYWNQ